MGPQGLFKNVFVHFYSFLVLFLCEPATWKKIYIDNQKMLYSVIEHLLYARPWARAESGKQM